MLVKNKNTKKNKFHMSEHIVSKYKRYNTINWTMVFARYLQKKNHSVQMSNALFYDKSFFCFIEED